MQEFLGWLIREFVLGLYWKFGAPLFERLPRSLRLGCNAIGIVLIAGFLGLVLYTLWVKGSG